MMWCVMMGDFWGKQDLDEEDAEELEPRLCAALCCLAETHMGQAGDVLDVAEECEALLLRAAQADATSPEPKQVSPDPHGAGIGAASAFLCSFWSCCQWLMSECPRCLPA